MDIPDELMGCFNYAFYSLYHIDDINSITEINEEKLKQIFDNNSSEIIEYIIKGLKWADQNPDSDLTSFDRDLKFSNKELHRYNKILLRSYLRGKELYS